MYSFVAVHRSSSNYTMATPTKSDAPAEELANLSVSEEGAGAANGSVVGAGTGDFRKTFTAFAKFGDSKSDGKGITLSQSDKWMKQAKVIDKTITTTDTGIQFKKHKLQKLTHDIYVKFLEDLAKAKKLELDDIKNKLANCGAPGVLSSTPGKAAATVDRLTDVKNYTGSHKERFDDSGKGKGIAGRKNLVDGSGYVSGYQHKDTYDKTH